jgi:glycogen debranching enzyme
MLTAGDEFGRTQHGNNNAYCQDNVMTWVDWAHRDVALEDYVARLSAQRAKNLSRFRAFPHDGSWLTPDGQQMASEDWEREGAGRLHWMREDRSGRIELHIDRAGRQAGVVQIDEEQENS